MKPFDVAEYCVYVLQGSINDNPYPEGTEDYSKFEEFFIGMIRWLDFNKYGLDEKRKEYVKDQLSVINKRILTNLVNK